MKWKIKPKKQIEKEIKQSQQHFSESEEKASWVGITIMIISLIALVGVLYLFYLNWNYEFIGVW